MVQGRPLELNWAAEHIPAILTTWYPGGEGGRAIADVLFGDYNRGRLPLSYPRHVGQLPVYYNHKSPNDMIMWRELLPRYILSGSG